MSRQGPQYPRVLHIGFTELGAANSAAITLGRAFEGWPDQRLLQVCLRPDSPTASVMDARNSCESVLDRTASQILNRPRPSGLGGGTARTSGFRELVRTVGDVRPVWVNRRLMAEVVQFSPDVIHCPVWGVRSMRVCVAVSRSLDIPIVPHFMDDWPSTMYTSGPGSRQARHAMQRALAALLARSPHLLTVGTLMAAEYQERYGRACTVVGNCVTAESSRTMREQTPARDKVLVYVGGLANRRGDVIEEVAAELPDGWLIRLHVNPKDAQLAQDLARRCVRVETAESLNPDQVPMVLGGASALLFIEADDARTVRYTRLSVSGKVPEYVLSGRPILAVGPTDQASLRALSESPLTTLAATPAAVAGVIAGLTTHATDTTDADLTLAAQQFSCQQTRARLRTTLSRVAGYHG